MRGIRSRARRATVAGCLTTLVAGLSTAQDSRPAAKTLAPVPVRDPLVAHTLYTWYTEKSFQQATVPPLERFRSDDPDYYRRYFPLLRASGVDVIAAVLTGLPGERRSDGRALATTYQADNLVRILPLVGSAGLKFFIYYDLAIRSYWKSGLSRGELDLGNGELRRQLLADFEWIAEGAVKQHEDSYLFLQTASGRYVLDEEGLRRPVVAIYLVRSLRDAPGFPAVAQVLDRELAEMFHRHGLGRPALVLDVVFWGRETFDPQLVRAFGTSATALTSFCPVTERRDARHLGDWVRLFAGLYAGAGREMGQLAAAGMLPATLQFWPGVMANFEKQGNRSGKARSVEEWEAMLRMGVEATQRLDGVGDDDPIRGMVIVYTDEYYEGTPLLADNGLFTLPLTVQGNVLKDLGIRLESF